MWTPPPRLRLSPCRLLHTLHMCFRYYKPETIGLDYEVGVPFFLGRLGGLSGGAL